MYLTFGDLKATGVAARVNLCADDDRFRDAVNRVTRWLLLYGSWFGTERIMQLRVSNGCIVIPGCVASVNGVYTPCGPVALQGIGYQFLATWRPISDCGAPLEFQAFDTVPTYQTISTPGYIRTYLGSLLDVGRRIIYLGTDENGKWIRTLQNGVMRDGEQVLLASPYVDTVNKFGGVSGVVKDETNDRVMAYVMPVVNQGMSDLSTFEYWETRPNYRRFKVPRYAQINCGCCQAVEALVKLEFIPVKNDNDLLIIGNVPALEVALEALKAKDDGDLVRADALLFGTRDNLRLGAIPLLNQELRTYTNDKFVGHVSVQGVPGMRRVTAGFI